MTLTRLLMARIAAEGPITLADYMAECLLHPVHGYYTTRDPLGVAGDFTTAPEISQMFGELIGLALAQCWLDQGSPAPFVLCEPGPGRGTLMNDILRATARVPGFHAAAQVILIEASPALAARQREMLAGKHDNITWRDHLADLPDLPLFLIANEFFDALPIRQFQRDGAAWRERMVGVLADTSPPALMLGLSAPAPLAMLNHRLADTRAGDLVEYSAAVHASAKTIAERIGAHGGAALIVDYGDWRSLGDTFQALRHHAAADPLADPGMADLTAHVDFETIAIAATPHCAHTLLTPQGVFLERLGITDRATALAQGQPADSQQSLVDAHRRLTHPDEMGTLFKILGLYPNSASPPPGLAPAKP